MGEYVVGKLDYIRENDRYGLAIGGVFVKHGFHNGEPLEVLVDGEWTQSCLDWDFEEGEWRLIGTPFHGNLFGTKARIRREY